MKSNTRARHKHKEQLFTSLYGQLYQYVYDCQPSLLFGDADSVLSLVANDLRSYSGKLTPDAMTKWANPIIFSHAKRLADTAAIYSQHKAYINRAINNTMPFGTFDQGLTINGVSTQDIAQEVAIQILSEVDDLAVPKPSDTAKQSTRVYAAAKKHTAFYHSMPIERRKNLLLARVEQGDAPYGDTEVWSAQEWEEFQTKERAA